MTLPDFDVDIDAGILAWETRMFDGTWSNSGVAVLNRPPKKSRDEATGEEWETPVMRSLMWRELYERERERSFELSDKARLVADIDRCEHGRHWGDICAECGGPSLGNPLLRQGPVTVGYTMSARRYVAHQGEHLRGGVDVE